MKTVIFGNGKFASLAWYCLSNDTADQVSGFTVDASHIQNAWLHGLPVAAFEEVESVFPPDQNNMLVHVGGQGMNALRMSRVAAARAKGYAFASYVSSRALTWPDLRIGENCVIYEGAIIQPFAVIGDNVIIRSGVHVSHHVEVGDHCFLSAGACLGGGATIRPRCFIGLGAIIRDGVTVAEGCLVGAGAVVTADTEPDGVYMGVPARRSATPASQLTSF